MFEKITLQSENKPATNDEMQEHDFYKKLERLPKELARIWLSKYEDLDDNIDDFFKNFEEFLQKRTDALSGTLEINTDSNETIREEILSVHESIKNTFRNSNYFLGNGRTAEVYSLSIAPHLCVKYIHNQEAYNENNHMRVEYEFLNQLHSFKLDNVRTPHPYFIRIHPSEGHSYGMERIMGENLSRILEKPLNNIELIHMLKTMDKSGVEQRIIQYVQALHKQFNVTHNDLFMRNIMVDLNGNFYIVDFGKAKHEELGNDHEQYRMSDIALATSEIRRFFKGIDDININ